MTDGSADDARSPALGSFIRCLAVYARAYRGLLAVIFFCLLVEMAFYSSLPICFKLVVDEVLLKGNERLLFRLLGLLSFGVALVTAVGLGRDYLAARVFAGMIGDLRARLFDHLQRLSLSHYARTSTGKTLTRFSGDMATIEHALTSAIPWAILPGLDVVASTSLLFVLDWRLALVAVLVFPLALAGPRLIAPRATRASYARNLEEARVLSHVQENISAQPVVKAFGLQDLARGGFRERNLTLMRSGVRLGFVNSLLERSANFGIHFLQVLVLGAGGYLAWRKQISIGSLAAFQTLFLNLSYSLSYATQYVPHFIHGAGAMQHINELLDEDPHVEDAPDAVSMPRLARELALREVTFSYSGQQANLENVSLVIPAGASVAFVGPSGSGKSTVINLVLRFYDPARGAVLLDNADLRQGTQQSLRAQCGIVFQESFLFNTTIRENIRLGRAGATNAEVEAAARAAEIHDLITSWPEGYDTMVGERGGRLSGGQRQRVAIARAMVRNPAILILDEATSALDPATEAALNATLARVSRDRTVLTVTHRLEAATGCDIIFVFEKGRLLEQGNHTKLLARRGLYHSLWRKQSGFEVSGDFEHVELTPEKVRDLPFFQQLPAEMQEEIASQFVAESVPPERVIFCEGDPGDRFYLIVRGRLAVFKAGAGGVERQVAVLEDGDYFGEIALLENVPRTATIRTVLPVVLLTLRRERFQQLLAQVPELRESLQTTIRQRQAPA